MVVKVTQLLSTFWKHQQDHLLIINKIIAQTVYNIWKKYLIYRNYSLLDFFSAMFDKRISSSAISSIKYAIATIIRVRTYD